VAEFESEAKFKEEFLMQTKVVVVLMVTASALWAADKYQPLDVKTGLWEVTTTISTSGQMPIPADLLEKLTPEQRARFEERMNAKSLQPAKPIVSRNCLTQEQLDKGDSFTENRKSCTHTIVSSTRSKAEVRLQCEEKDMKFDVKLQFEAIDSENVRGQTQSIATGGDHSMNANSTFTAKWISPNCGTTK
jgi:hypothetical protein